MQLRAISPSDGVDLDVLLTDCLVQLSLHPIIGPKECEDQSSQEGKDDGARDENLVLQLRLQSYEEAASAHQRQQHCRQENLAHGAHLLLRNHDLLGLFVLNNRLKKKNQSSVFVFSRKDRCCRSDPWSLLQSVRLWKSVPQI